MPWTRRNPNVRSAWIPWWFEAHPSHRSHPIRMSMSYAGTFTAIINGVSKTTTINRENVLSVEQLARWFRLHRDWSPLSTSFRARITSPRHPMLFIPADTSVHNRQLCIGRRSKYRMVSGGKASDERCWYFSSLGAKGLKSICPFCSTMLSETKPCVRLIFQDSIYR